MRHQVLGEADHAADVGEKRGAGNWLRGVRLKTEKEKTDEREQAEAGDHHTLASDQVAETASQKQQAGEGDQIGVDDPGQAGLREAEIALDGRQRNVDDGLIENGHKETEDHNAGDNPFVSKPGPGCGGGILHENSSLEKRVMI